MFTVKYDQRTRYDSKGRNGFLGTTGISVGLGIDGEIALAPITTRGEPADSCRIIVRDSAVDALIGALLDARDGRWGCWIFESNSWLAKDDGSPLEFKSPGRVWDHIVARFGPNGRDYPGEPRLINPHGGADVAKALRAARALVPAYRYGVGPGDKVEWEHLDEAASLAAEALGEDLNEPLENSETEEAHERRCPRDGKPCTSGADCPFARVCASEAGEARHAA